MSVFQATRQRRGMGVANLRVAWPEALLAVVALLVMVPLVFLVLGSLSTAKLPTDFSFSELSLKNYFDVWLDPTTYRLFSNTGIYVVSATVWGIGGATVLAWISERTNIRGKLFIYAGVSMSLALPGMLQAMAYAMLFSPRSGFFNVWLMNLFGLESAPFNIYSLSGMAFVEGLHIAPTAFLMLVPLMRSMDRSLEEAAAMSGASPARTMRRITLVLLLPGIIAVTMYQAMTALESFEVPGILGMPVGIHVFSTKIYSIVQEIEQIPQFGKANALGMLYLLIGLVVGFFYWSVISRAARYTVITGKGYRPKLTDLGPWRLLAGTFVVVFMLLSVLFPFLVMLYISLVPVMQPPSWSAVSSMSFDHYLFIFGYSRFWSTLGNTAVMVIGAATLTCILSFFIAFVVVRTNFWGRRLLDQLAFVPHTIPGVVAGLAFLWLTIAAGIFGTVLSIVIAFTVILMSYGTRTLTAALLQVHKELEEAAHVAGASPRRVMARVLVPLVMPSLIGLWIWVVFLTSRIASVPLVLYQGQSNEVIAVMMWNMWDTGDIEVVGAINVLMMLTLFALVMVLRRVGFAKGVATP